MAAAHKKSIVRLVDGATVAGYLPASGFMSDGSVEMLDTGGTLICLKMSDIETICYVRDFNTDDSSDPERLGRRSFAGRPRAPGLWLRVTLRNAEPLEGLADADLSLCDGLLWDGGLFLTPPDLRANTQRIFIPRPAITALEVLGLIGAPAAKKPARPKLPTQPTLFPG